MVHDPSFAEAATAELQAMQENFGLNAGMAAAPLEGHCGESDLFHMYIIYTLIFNYNYIYMCKFIYIIIYIFLYVHVSYIYTSTMGRTTTCS